MSSQSVSQKLVSQPKMPWRPQLFGPVASSKKDQLSQKPKQVESQPLVESVCQPETSQSAESAFAVTNIWASGVVERSSSQPKTETRRKSAISRISQSTRNQSVSRRCPGGHKWLGQWRRRRKSKSAENRWMSKVKEKSTPSVSQKQVSEPEVHWRPQVGEPVASSKEVPASQKPKKVESQPKVESVCQPETSH